MSTPMDGMFRIGYMLHLVRKIEPTSELEIPYSEQDRNWIFPLQIHRYEVKGLPKSLDGILLASPDGPVKREQSLPSPFLEYTPPPLDSWNSALQFSILENLQKPSRFLAGFVPAEKDYPRPRGVTQWIHGLRMLGFHHTLGILGPGDQLTHSAKWNPEMESREIETLNQKADVSILDRTICQPIPAFHWGGIGSRRLNRYPIPDDSLEETLPDLLAERPNVLLLPTTPKLTGMGRGHLGLAKILRQFRFQGLLVVSSPKLPPGWFSGEPFGVVNTYGTLVFLVHPRPKALQKPLFGKIRFGGNRPM